MYRIVIEMFNIPGDKRAELIKRIQRIVESERCDVKEISKYNKELRQLVAQLVNEGELLQLSKILKAISDPTRLKIIKLLNVHDMCVCEIMSALNLTQPTASHHLNILENVGLLKYERMGKWTFYSLNNPNIIELLEKFTSLIY